MRKTWLKRGMTAVAAAAYGVTAAAAPATASAAAPFAIATASDSNGTVASVCEYVAAVGASSTVATHGTTTAVGPAIATSIHCEVVQGSRVGGCSASMPGAVATCTNAESFPIGAPTLCAEGWVLWANGSILTTAPC